MSERENCPRCGAPLPSDTPPEGCPRCLIRLGMERAGPETVTSSGHDRPVPSIEQLAPLFPQLELLELLGQGGMGVVYKARQKSLDRPVALKILTVDSAAGPDFEERFAREARALASLSHPAIVTIHDFGHAGDYYFLLMEYVDGPNLRQLMRAGQIEPRHALQIVTQICDALQFAHEEGVVHRDIKPENILVDPKGRVRIADFGLAKMLGKDGGDAGLTRTHQAMGTTHYMAPEQIERPLEVDHRADIFSLGVVFYELLTGELPLGRFSLPSEKVRVDVRLDEVVLRALEKEPQLRYQNASQIKTDVEGIGAAGSAGAPPKQSRAKAKPESDPGRDDDEPIVIGAVIDSNLGGRRTLLAVVIVVAILASFALYVLQRDPEPEAPVTWTIGGSGQTVGGTGESAAVTEETVVSEIAGRSIERSGNGGANALVEAARAGHLDSVLFLISGGRVDVNAESFGGARALNQAAENGHIEIVDRLIAAGADVNAPGFADTHAIVGAATNNRIDVVRVLIAAGADVDGRGMFENTALIVAAERGHVAIARMLLDAGADPELTNVLGQTAAMAAAAKGRTEILTLFD